MILFFLDVACAFASMVRRFAVPVPDSDEAWLRHLRNCGFSEVEVKEIYDEAVNCVSLGEAGVPPHVVDMLGALHRFTWSSTEGLPNVFQSTRGTLAGTAIADVLFIFSLHKVFQQISDFVHRRGFGTYYG